MLVPTSGHVLIEGRDVALEDPIQLRRRIGYVIQEFGLLPHWTVEDNVALVPRLSGWSSERRERRAHDLLEAVGLPPGETGKRYPAQLSGGQRQRVGVARALAAEPDLMLLDEPFGALDPVTRHEMQQQFIALRDRYHGASVFVTHDLAEALTVATRIAVMHQGRLEGVFTPAEFLHAATPEARAFLNTLPPGLLNGRK
jgi:osmoprotectant transport system ATP-binding protein